MTQQLSRHHQEMTDDINFETITFASFCDAMYDNIIKFRWDNQHRCKSYLSDKTLENFKYQFCHPKNEKIFNSLLRVFELLPNFYGHLYSAHVPTDYYCCIEHLRFIYEKIVLKYKIVRLKRRISQRKCVKIILNEMFGLENYNAHSEEYYHYPVYIKANCVNPAVLNAASSHVRMAILKMIYYKPATISGGEKCAKQTQFWHHLRTFADLLEFMKKYIEIRDKCVSERHVSFDEFCAGFEPIEPPIVP